MEQLYCSIKNKKYKHLKEKERYQIEGLLKGGVKAGEKRIRKNIFSGDFDVFASCLRQAAVITPRL